MKKSFTLIPSHGIFVSVRSSPRSNKKILIKRIILSTVGVFLTGICIGLQRKAELGTDPFTCFVSGFANLFSTSYGIMYPIITAILLIAVFIVEKHYIGLATVINLFFIGITADFSLTIFDRLYEVVTLLDKGLTLGVAVVLLCFAAAMYISANLGVSSYDAVSLIISDKTSFQYRWCRIASDLTCVLVGFLLSATVGMGTVIIAFGMGPLTQFFRTRITDLWVAQKKRTMNETNNR